MLILVSGGSASGKSKYAEDLVVKAPPGERIYVATMRVWDEESRRRVERHRAMRAGKGFRTEERPVHLSEMPVPAGAVVLLEDLSNLTANEWFGPAGPAGAEERVLSGIKKLQREAACTVVVTNELFSDGIPYDEETADYLAALARLNGAIAARADQVYEVVCGIPVCWKGA